MTEKVHPSWDALIHYGAAFYANVTNLVTLSPNGEGFHVAYLGTFSFANDVRNLCTEKQFYKKSCSLYILL